MENWLIRGYSVTPFPAARITPEQCLIILFLKTSSDGNTPPPWAAGCHQEGIFPLSDINLP